MRSARCPAASRTRFSSVRVVRVVEVSFSCCFFGGARETEDPITLTASWVDVDGEARWQAWGAHRRCLLDNFSEMGRAFGGPIFGDEDPWPPE